MIARNRFLGVKSTMKTKDKIVKVSLELFNEHGAQTVTTNHIAAHMGISPGNLYYHFRNKEDIVNSIFTQYAEQMDSLFCFESNMDMPEVIATFARQIVDGMWRFRFFFSSMPLLLQKDEKLRERYLELQQRILARSKDFLHKLREEEYVEIASHDIDDLVETIRLVNSFGVGFLMCKAKESLITRVDAFEIVVKLLSLYKAHGTVKGTELFHSVQEYYRSQIAEFKA